MSAANVGLRSVSLPRMLPITGTWTLPLTAYLTLLSARVCHQRLRTSIYIGDDPASTPPRSASPAPLTLASRAHINFLENAPLALVLAAVAELNGANKRVLNVVMGVFLVLRVVHAEFGLMREGGRGWGRVPGYYGTVGVLLGLAGWTGVLVGGYWGW